MNADLFTTLLEGALRRRTSGLRVSLPGRIEFYDESTRRAVVQPLIMDGVVIEGERTAAPIAAISDVPVMFPGGADGVRMRWDIKPGCPCLLEFSSSSIARLKAGDSLSVVDPGDDAHHQLRDAIAIPGDFGIGSSGDADAAIVFVDDEVRLGGAAATEPALRGDEYTNALREFFNIVKTAVGSIPGGGAASATIEAAIADWLASASDAKSSTVKVL